MAKVEVLIGGTRIDVLQGSLAISQTLGGRSTAEFRQIHPISVTPPEIGREVLIEKDGVRLFGGQIYSVRRQLLPGQYFTESEYSCHDWQQILDRRSAGERTFVGALAGDIVRELIDSLNEGFTTAGVQDGPVVERIHFDYPTTWEALVSVADIAGMFLAVGPLRDVQLLALPSAANAPFSVTSVPETNNVRRLSVSPDRTEYANKVVVRVSQYVLEPREERFGASGRTGGDPDPEPEYATDGTRQSFVVTYPLHAVPLVTVDGVAQTVGIKGGDTAQWYWSQGSSELEQDAAQPALTPAHTLSITYSGLSTATVFDDDPAAIAARAAIEHTTGIAEIVLDASGPTTRVAATQLAASSLARRSEMTVTASYETDEDIEPGLLALRVGHRQQIARAGLAADGLYLIRSIRWFDRRGREGLGAHVEAVKGPLLDSAVTFFGGKSNAMSAVAPAVTQVVQIAYA